MQTLKAVPYYKKDGKKEINGYYVYVTKKQAAEAGFKAGDYIQVHADGDTLVVTKVDNNN